MAKRETESKAPVVDSSNQRGVRSGNIRKLAHHEGLAGSGGISRSKFGKEGRDAVSEKEPGKSRGPNG